MIRIRRGLRKHVDALRSYEIILDGNVIGQIHNGEVFEYAPSPGSHTLRLKIDWCGSNQLNFDVQEDEVVNFECGGLKGYKLWLVYWILIFQRNRYLWLEKVGTNSLTDAPSMTSEHAEHRRLLQAGQKWRFVFRYGVLGWGIITGVLFQIFGVITGSKNTLVSWPLTIGIFMIGGLFWGLFMWHWIQRREGK